MPKTTLKKLQTSEHEIQAAFFKIVRLHQKTYPALKLMFAVPNAAKRSISLAAYMKAEGMVSGVPDVFLPVSRGIYKGLCFEFKSATGKVTVEQAAFMELLKTEGWYVAVVKDADIAWQLVKMYLSEGK